MAKRYFADYFDEYVYEVDENGRGIKKDTKGNTTVIHPQHIPWTLVENECERTVQPISKEEY